MLIEVHSLLHNEILLLPYFIKHYSQFANIIFYESNSTDGSPEMANLLGCKVVKVESNNNLIDENVFLRIKNNCWKNSKADWVIICDTDEFVYHPNLIKILERTQCTVIQPREYLMYSRKFPDNNGQLYDKIKYGKLGNSGFGKINLFKPSQIREINYFPGCHVAKPIGNVVLLKTNKIKTLHFHYAGLDYRLAKNRYISSRISQANKGSGFGTHCTRSQKVVRKEFNLAMKSLVKVIE